MMFNFWVNQHLWLALASADARPLAQALRAHAEASADGAQWAHFLRNHDELDLGRLTRRSASWSSRDSGRKPSMQLYGRGIRRRPAPMLGDRRRLRARLQPRVLAAGHARAALRGRDRDGRRICG